MTGIVEDDNDTDNSIVEGGVIDEELLDKVNTHQNVAYAFIDPTDKDYTDLVIEDDDGHNAHDKLLDDIIERLSESETAMCSFYGRWCEAETALFNMEAPEEAKRQIFSAEDDRDEYRDDEEVEVPTHRYPLAWATLQTVVAYMMQTFVARPYVFELDSINSSDAAKATKVKKKLQSEFLHNKGVDLFWSWFSSCFTYGVGAIEVQWTKKIAMRSQLVRAENVAGASVGAEVGANAATHREDNEAVIYEGNALYLTDPFALFPDPSVPLSMAAEKGDFLFARSFPSVLKIKKEVYANALTKPWKDVSNKKARNYANTDATVAEHARERALQSNVGSRRVQLDSGSMWIVPEDYWTDEEMVDLSITEPDKPQLWYFVVLNKTQILYAWPFENDFQKHPFVIVEPYGDNLTFDPRGINDYLSGLEDTASFLVNSRIAGTRTALNQKILYDDNVVDLESFTSTAGGLFIPMRASGLQKDPKQALLDFTPKNPTEGNFADLQLIVRIADMILGTNDNTRGMPHQGGRKSATEVRTANQQSSGRQAVNAMRVSSQGVVPMGEMMVMNNTQFLSEDFEQQLFGSEGDDTSKISLSDFSSAFTFPVHDGTIPLDKIALLSQWANIFGTMAADPELRQQYDINRIFGHMAMLGGVDNLDTFKAKAPPAGQGPVPAQPLVPAAGGAAPKRPPGVGGAPDNTSPG